MGGRFPVRCIRLSFRVVLWGTVMTYLSGKICTEKGKHRLHERLNTLLIVTSSIGISATLIVDGKVAFTPGSIVTLECIQADKEVRIPFVGPVEVAIKNLIPDKIEVDFMPKSKGPDHKVYTEGFAKMMAHIISAFFGDFYEAYADWLGSNIDSDPYKWPTIWNFGRVVRNSGAHGGAIYFVNPRAAPVKWYNLEYGPSDNGRPVLFNDLSVGDFIVLMFEMSGELDKLKAPII